jgi:hypothetical protein
MKNSLKLFVGMLFIVSLAGNLSSCSSSSDSAATPAVAQLPGSKGTVTATINGQGFASNFAAGAGSGVLSVSGNYSTTTGTKQIAISGMITKTGTYQMNDIGGNNFAIALYTETTVTSSGSFTIKTYSATSGSLVVTQLSTTKAKGTFSFAASDGGGQNVNVTNGVFDINL